MPTNTGEERKSYLTQITSELPAFLDILLNYEILEHIRGQRTGVQSDINPDLANRKEESVPEIVLIELIQGAFKAGIIRSADEPWRGAAMELHGRLTDAECPNWRVAADRFGGARSMGVFLARLAEQSDHFAKKIPGADRARRPAPRVRHLHAAPTRRRTRTPMSQKLYTPEQVAEYLGISVYTLSALIRSKQIACCRVGGCKRITEAQVEQYLKLAASRPPRKYRRHPPIPADLSPVWQQLTDIALAECPLLAPCMQDATLVSINKQSRIVTVNAHTAEAALAIDARPNKAAIQRHLRVLFSYPLRLSVTCL